MAEKKTKTNAEKRPDGSKAAAAAQAAADLRERKEAFANDPSRRTIVNDLKALTLDLQDLMEYFMELVNLYNNLMPKERGRLSGAGVRKYGFIEKTRDIARDNPHYFPPNFDVAKYSADLEIFDLTRQYFLTAEKNQSIAADSMLLQSNELYSEGRRVYNTLREQARAKVAGARDLFNALEPFFKRRKVTDRPPTEAEKIKRAASLIKGTTEGEMTIKNIKPKKSGGVHEVVEDIHP